MAHSNSCARSSGFVSQNNSTLGCGLALEGSLPLIRRPGGAQLPYEMDPFGPKNLFYVWFQGRAYYSHL